MKGEPMKTENSSQLTPEQFARLKRISGLPDQAISTSDIPEVLDWAGAKRGLFYTGPREKIAVGVDSDLVVWFESQSSPGEEPEARINQALRAYVTEQAKKAG
jgi:uncharacterized protein (DUF4415 family)